MNEPIAVLDVGGSSVKRGVFSDGRVRSLPPTPIDARGPADEILATLGGTVRELLATHRRESVGHEIRRLAVSVPSPFDPERGVSLMLGQSKFDAIHGRPLRPHLRESFDGACEAVDFFNDAESAAVGEAIAGAGADVGRMLMVTLGTGLGAALVDRRTVVPRVGDLVVGELYTRATTVGGRAAPADDVLSARGLADRLGVEFPRLAESIDDECLADEIVAYGVDLGRFLDGVGRTVGPDLIVIGGGLAGSFERFESGLSTSLSFPVAPARLGDDAALYGAAHLSIAPAT